MEAERNYLLTLLTDGRKAIADGMYLEDALETMSRDAASKWTLNERHPRNVSQRIHIHGPPGKLAPTT